jgi:hypothetical protein
MPLPRSLDDAAAARADRGTEKGCEVMLSLEEIHALARSSVRARGVDYDVSTVRQASTHDRITLKQKTIVEIIATRGESLVVMEVSPDTDKECVARAMMFACDILGEDGDQ